MELKRSTKRKVRMQLPDDDPLSLAVWHLGKGFQHMRHEQETGFNSPEMTALETFWTETASHDLSRENVSKLVEMARAIPGFPSNRLTSAEQLLAQVSVA
jgi:hypothetical protein